MNLKRSLFAVVAVFGLAQSLSAQTAPLHSSDLIDAPSDFAGRTVVLDIVESLQAVQGHGICVSAPEAMSCTLALVPQTFELGDPDRYQREFGEPLVSPVRVRGELLSDDETARTTHVPAYRFRVSSFEPLPADTPTRFDSVAELLAQKEHFNRRIVTVEGSWRRGFEVSKLDSRIWISTRQDAVIVGTPDPKQPLEGRRVRITGLVFARPNGAYGHMGACPMLIVASRIEYLGSRR